MHRAPSGQMPIGQMLDGGALRHCAVCPARAEYAYAFLALLVFNAMPFIVGDQPQGVENLNPAEALKAVSTAGDATKQLILAGLYGSAMVLLLRQPFRMIGYLGVPTLLLTG